MQKCYKYMYFHDISKTNEGETDDFAVLTVSVFAVDLQPIS